MWLIPVVLVHSICSVDESATHRDTLECWTKATFDLGNGFAALILKISWNVL